MATTVAVFSWCFVVAAVCTLGSAELFIERASELNKVHPGHCYSSTYDLGPMTKFERRQIPGKCELAECRSNGDVAFARCGKVTIKEPCLILEGDRSLPYPDCCFQIRCYFDE